MTGAQDEIDVAKPRGHLAVRLRDVIQRRWSAEVRAIGVHGSLAHGDDADGSDVNLLVVTYRPDAGPRAGAAPGRRHPGRPQRGRPPRRACAGPAS